MTGAVLGFLAVATGAFGAHALKPILLESGRIEIYELAVRYLFYHCLALLAVGIIMQFNVSTKLRYASLFFLLGVFFFSGSLFCLSFLKMGLLGVVTPVGGLFLILGWAFLVLGVAKKK
jgi:uncharacterized membrane protein YgdD (TMEM256/DUF423 family)